MWKKLRQPLSGLQMIAVTIAVLLAGGVVYGLYYGAAVLWHRHGAIDSIPGALNGVRKQRDDLIGLIELYRKHFGYYPPMSAVPNPERGKVNPLCYELVGVQFEPIRKEFHIPITKDAISVGEVQQNFHTSTFSNCCSYPMHATNFLGHQTMAVSMMAKDEDLYGVGINFTEIVPEPFWYDYNFSSWRYTTNPAQHNPGKFDIWVDVDVAGRHFIIGNWPEVN